MHRLDIFPYCPIFYDFVLYVFVDSFTFYSYIRIIPSLNVVVAFFCVCHTRSFSPSTCFFLFFFFIRKLNLLSWIKIGEVMLMPILRIYPDSPSHIVCDIRRVRRREQQGTYTAREQISESLPTTQKRPSQKIGFMHICVVVVVVLILCPENCLCNYLAASVFLLFDIEFENKMIEQLKVCVCVCISIR